MNILQDVVSEALSFGGAHPQDETEKGLAARLAPFCISRVGL